LVLPISSSYEGTYLRLVNEELTAVSYETTFNTSNIIFDIYFYVLTTGGFSEVIKEPQAKINKRHMMSCMYIVV